MRYIMTVIWAVLISTAISYVLSSMGGEAFIFSEALILAGIIAVGVIILGDGVLKENNN